MNEFGSLNYFLDFITLITNSSCRRDFQELMHEHLEFKMSSFVKVAILSTLLVLIFF